MSAGGQSNDAAQANPFPASIKGGSGDATNAAARLVPVMPITIRGQRYRFIAKREARA